MTPTIGRIIWYYAGRNEGLGIKPLAAVIAAVLSDSRVAIGGFDAVGRHFHRPSVAFVQDGEEAPIDHSGINGYAKWPEHLQKPPTQIEPTVKIDGRTREGRKLRQAT